MKKLFNRLESAADRERFLAENARANLHSGAIMVSVVMAFELVLLVRMLCYDTPHYSGRTLGYVSCYVILLALSAVNLAGVLWIRHSGKPHRRLADFITVLYCFGILLWSIAITVLDSQKSEQFIVYLTVVLGVVSLLRLRPWLFLSLQLGGLAALSAALLCFVPDFRSSQLINLGIFTIVFIIISVTKYNAGVAEFYTKRRIEQLNGLLEKEKAAIERAAKTDPLTGLNNRYSLKETVGEQVRGNYRRGCAMGFAMFDLDNFKQINDHYGHAVGDECLRKLGACFQAHPQLTVYRYGGEEFLAVCDGIPEGEFEKIILEIVAQVAQFSLSVEELRITISAGYTYAIPRQEDCDEELIRTADSALYLAKTAGKNRAVKA